jgi:hypothetical protein
MSTFDLYIHGTPNGHQIWGSEKNHYYISNFYNHDANFPDKAALQIDICMQDSYYTYIRQQNVYDSNERPGSFFAMTVCFTKAYCTNVYKLFQIFEAVYNQVCIGSLITLKQNKEIYLVSDFEASRTGNTLTVDRIRNIFNKNIGDLIEPYLLAIGGVSDTFNKPKKQISLLEVDSPLFLDLFKRQSIVVLPNLEPTIITNQTLLKQLNAVSTQKKSLETANVQLMSEIDSLQSENKTITTKFHASESSAERKYSATINQLKTELNAVTHERDELKAKIDEAKSSIEIIDKPFQKLTRLMAGRFPEYDEKHPKDNANHIRKDSSKDRNQVWYSRVNTILLSLILVCVILVLVLTLKSSFNYSSMHNNEPEDAISSSLTETHVLDENYNDSESLSNDTNGTDSYIEYDDENSCEIDISGKLRRQNGEIVVVAGNEYQLSIKRKNDKTVATVPDGTWSVEINEGSQINSQDKFVVPQDASGKNVLIKYNGGDHFHVSRIIKVK